MDPWSQDKLNRKGDGEHLIEVLLSRYEALHAAGNGSYILNIDASWGMGKTFFLDNLRADLQSRKHIVATVNAWQDDHSNDPLITVMAAIEKELLPYYPKSKKVKNAFAKSKRAMGIVAAETGKQVALHAVKTITGIGIKSIIEAMQNSKNPEYEYDDEAFDNAADSVWEKSLETLVGERLLAHQKMSNAIDTFRTQTALAIQELPSDKCKSPFFVFIDELDRCRPLYAIKLLEEIKHLFSIEGVVFVLATDSEQLSHSVKAIYGAEFESRKYLRRFFDRVFVFPDTNRYTFIAALFEKHGINPETAFSHSLELKPTAIFQSWADAFRLSNRDLDQCFEIIATFVTSWPHPVTIEPIYLLVLVHSFYVQNDPEFSELKIADPKAMAVNEWELTYYSSNAPKTEKNLQSTRVALFMSGLKSWLSKPLHTIEFAEALYAKQLWSEARQRFGGEIHTNAVTVLNEYQSRVRNAGRFIDPKTQ